jgi:hypothetical protein
MFTCSDFKRHLRLLFAILFHILNCLPNRCGSHAISTVTRLGEDSPSNPRTTGFIILLFTVIYLISAQLSPASRRVQPWPTPA